MIVFPVGSKVRYGGQRGGVVLAVEGDRRAVQWSTYRGNLLASSLLEDKPFPRSPTKKEVEAALEIPKHLWPKR